MGLRPDEDANSLGQGGLELLIQLIDADFIAKVENVLLVLFGDLLILPPGVVHLAAEDNANVKRDKNVVISRAGLDWELVCHVLFRNQELYLSPRQAPDQPAFVHDLVEGAELCNNRVSALRNVDVRHARGAGGNEHDRSVAISGVIAEPLETVVNVTDAQGDEVRV